MTISAHSQLNSLIEITGLHAPPKTVSVETLDGVQVVAGRATSIAELRRLKIGYWLKYAGRLSTVVVRPGRTGELGHSMCLYF